MISILSSFFFITSGGRKLESQGIPFFPLFNYAFFFNRPPSMFPGTFQGSSLGLSGTIIEPVRVAVFLFNRGRLTDGYPPIDMLRI